MRELLHQLASPRALPLIGTGTGLPLAVVGIIGETDWHKGLGLGGVVLVFLTQLLKLAVDLNGMGKSLRSYNSVQDAQLEDHERRLKRLERAP